MTHVIYFHQKKRELNQIVIDDSFMLPTTELAEKYSELEEHVMLDSISLCRRLAGRLLGLRMGFYKRVSTLNKRHNQDLDTATAASFMADLEDKIHLGDMKIMGALLHPLYQTKACMIEGSLCTEEQYMAGKEELLDRLSHYYEGTTEDAAPTGQHDSTNEWDGIELLDSSKASKTSL